MWRKRKWEMTRKFKGKIKNNGMSEKYCYLLGIVGTRYSITTVIFLKRAKGDEGRV
jgi:hypothetical protein